MNYGLSLRLGLELLLWTALSMALVITGMILIKFRAVRRQLQEPLVTLELLPPPLPQSTLQATSEFFTVLSHVLNTRSWRDLIHRRKARVILEVVSTRSAGIRYLIHLPVHDRPIFLHNLAALAPTVTATEATDYLTPADETQVERVIDIRQTGPRNYAIRHSYQESALDPIAYVTNAISGLEDTECIVLQLVLTPGIDTPILQDAGLSQGVVPPDLVNASLHKQAQVQFLTSLRLFIRTTDQLRYDQRLKGLRGALAAYSYEGYQSFQPRLDLPGWLRRYRYVLFQHRLPQPWRRHSCLLASSEIAALYHFPYGTAIRTEDIQIANQITLPLPLEVKNQAAAAEVLLGENTYRGRVTPFGLTAAERERHVYMVGGTGNGKSTMLEYAITQDMQNGKGVAVIDPHGDLAESLLAHVPDARIDDVIYFNPSDIRYPIGLNLLEVPAGLTGDELLAERDLVAESIVSMFRKIFSTNGSSAHRIEYILRNVIHTALTLESATLFTVYELLNDTTYRKRITDKLDNPDLRLFWREFGKAGSFQQVGMAAGVTAKIGRFLFSTAARRILEQPVSSINFDELMQQDKILICNVSKGQLGEDTAELFGIMLLTKLQLAAMRRARLPAKARRPFYVYVDEFQNFATPSFAQLLSEARKYKLYLTMAEQSTAQQHDPHFIDVVLANVGTLIAFRTSSPQDEALLAPLLGPHLSNGALSQLPAYHCFVRIATRSTPVVFSGRTVRAGSAADRMLPRIVVQASRMKYGLSPPPRTAPLTTALQPLLQTMQGGSL